MTTINQSPSEQITAEVTSWPGVAAGTGRRGEFAFKVGRREIGHLHGDHAAHFSFPKAVWADLMEQGRIVPHPVFPDAEGPAARRIGDEDDVRDVIALLRLNYDRAVARARWPEILPGLHASPPQPLSFAPSLHIRAFLLRRPAGNVLAYSVDGLAAQSAALDVLGGVSRQYLGHHHEVSFAADPLPVPRFVHAADRAAAEAKVDIRAAFSRRHTLDGDLDVIPIPGHTAGATALLWNSGGHRMLFPGDTIYIADGEWVGAVLGTSDRERTIESLELIRGLDFDVLVPWAATAGQAAFAMTDADDARGRIDTILQRVRDGGAG